MLKKIKQDYISKNVQFILTDAQGAIIESDQTFIQVIKGTQIEDIHPFFNGIYSIENLKDNTTTFNCVQLGENVMEFIVDIEMTLKTSGFLIMIHDLTAHYRSYQEIAQARNESFINSELIVLKNLELEEREKFKNEFIRNFSHELRNPLTSIVSITGIIQSTELTAEQRKMVDFLRESNANLKLMLEDILSISMISTGKLKLNATVFNLIELLELIKFTYNARAKEQGLIFKLVVDDKVPESVEGDRLRLYQVLTNLIENAFKCTTVGQISLHVQFNQKWAKRVNLRFEVSDTGVGIPKESIESIFESFSQLQPNGKNGAGLGLSIVKGILGLMESKIEVNSTHGEGSKFYFDLTLVQPLRKPIKPDSKSINKSKRVFQGENKEYSILLVENDEQVQMMLFKILLAQKCFKIDFESDGAKVMERIVNKAYDLILMDVNLPNVDGDDITRLIRNFPFKNIKKIPIVGITANAYPDDIKAYKKAGMNAVISKPFEADHLLDVMFKYV